MRSLPVVLLVTLMLVLGGVSVRRRTGWNRGVASGASEEDGVSIEASECLVRLAQLKPLKDPNPCTVISSSLPDMFQRGCVLLRRQRASSDACAGTKRAVVTALYCVLLPSCSLDPFLHPCINIGSIVSRSSPVVYIRQNHDPGTSPNQQPDTMIGYDKSRVSGLQRVRHVVRKHNENKTTLPKDAGTSGDGTSQNFVNTNGGLDADLAPDGSVTTVYRSSSCAGHSMPRWLDEQLDEEPWGASGRAWLIEMTEARANQGNWDESLQDLMINPCDDGSQAHTEDFQRLTEFSVDIDDGLKSL